MFRQLTPQSSLESLKKEAKRWLKALRANDAEARARLQRAHPNAPLEPGLRDVQHALALEHGVSGWNTLTNLFTPTALHQYEEMADALLDAYRTGTPAAMERHWNLTWHRRNWESMRTYVQLDLGRRPEAGQQDNDISLADARTFVAREHGFHSWQALTEYVTALPSKQSAIAAKPVTLLSLDEKGASQRVARAQESERNHLARRGGVFRLCRSHQSGRRHVGPAPSFAAAMRRRRDQRNSRHHGGISRQHPRGD